MFSNWSPRLPEIKQELHLSNEQIGFSLLGMSLGAVCAVFFNSFLHKKCGSITIIRCGVLGICGVYLLLPHAHTAYQLAIIFFLLGALFQPLDVNVSAMGAQYEKITGKHILVRLHGFFSLGAFIAALSSSICATKNISYQHQFTVVSLIALCLAGYVAMNISPLPQSTTEKYHEKIHPNIRLLVLGVLVFCAAFIEGTTIDWSTLFLVQAKNIPEEYAGYGFALFNLAIVCGRFCGDYVRAKLGIARTFTIGTLITVSSLIGIMLLPSYYSLALYLFLGVGLCIYVPLLISSASILFPNTPHSAITVISAIGVGAMICAPPAMGYITQTLGMQRGMWIQPIASFVVLLLLPIFITELARRPNATSREEDYHSSGA